MKQKQKEHKRSNAKIYSRRAFKNPKGGTGGVRRSRKKAAGFSGEKQLRNKEKKTRRKKKKDPKIFYEYCETVF